MHESRLDTGSLKMLLPRTPPKDESDGLDVGDSSTLSCGTQACSTMSGKMVSFSCNGLLLEFEACTILNKIVLSMACMRPSNSYPKSMVDKEYTLSIARARGSVRISESRQNLISIS